MATKAKIDSNATGLRYQLESAFGTPNTGNDFVPMAVNSYGSFGANFTPSPRTPIVDDRSNRKGDIVNFEAPVDFSVDLTQTSVQNLMPSLFFADFRAKGEEDVTAIVTTDTYEMADTTGFFEGSLVFASGFGDSTNNGLKTVTSVSLNVSITVSETLVNDASPASGAQVVVVGHEFDAGDLDVDDSGDFATLTTSTKDLTELGLKAGEVFYIGGDSASLAFSTSGNNGFKRARSIDTNALVIDKSLTAMSTEASTTETVQIFYGRVVQNEEAALQVRRSALWERTLGAPDDTSPSDIQAEYVGASVFNEYVINKPDAEKITCDLSWVGTTYETVDAATSLKTAASRPALADGDAYNSTDVSFLNLGVVSTTTEEVTPIVQFFQSMTQTITNNASGITRCGKLGPFEVQTGNFGVSISLQSYYQTVALQAAVQDNEDVSFWWGLVKDNKGIAWDFPLGGLSEGNPTVEQDSAIIAPITFSAATGKDVLPTYTHTAMCVHFDYLPDAALPSS